MKKICIFTLICSAFMISGCSNFDSSLDNVPTDSSDALASAYVSTISQPTPEGLAVYTTSTAISYTFSHIDSQYPPPATEYLGGSTNIAGGDGQLPDPNNDNTAAQGSDKISSEDPDNIVTGTALPVTTSVPEMTTVTTTQTSVSFSSVSKKVYVSDSAVFYGTASESGSIIRYINSGSEITVIAQSTDGKWYNVVYNGITGYVKASQTSTNKPVVTTTTTTTTTTKATTKSTTKATTKSTTKSTTKATTKSTPKVTTAPKTTTTANTLYPLEAKYESQRKAAENEIVKYTNELRASLGEGTLSVDSRLCHAAMIRAQEIASNFAHKRPDGSSSLTIFDEVGCGDFYSMGENIASASGFMQTGNGFFEQWKNSKGHYENMTNPKYNTIGVAVYYVMKDGRNYCYSVQLFGRK